jgi:hypothetical protein
MSVVNAFNWKQYTDEEHAKHGDPFKDIKRSAALGATVTKTVHKIREKNPTHGTLFGLTAKELKLKEPEMMRKPK